MAEIEMSPEAITPAVQAALDEMDPTVIEHVMEALAAVGPKAVPVLTNALKNDKTRRAAIIALMRDGPEAKPATAALIEILQDKDAEIVSLGATALGAIGPDAAPAVPALVKMLSQPDRQAHYAAVLALGAHRRGVEKARCRRSRS